MGDEPGTRSARTSAPSDTSPPKESLPAAGRARRLSLTGVAMVTAAIALASLEAGWLRPLELDLVDARFALRGERKPPRQVVLIGVDTRSLRSLDLRLPLPRSEHAELLDELDRARPRLIAYDIQFIGRTNPQEDRALVAAVRRARPVLLATQDSEQGPIPVPAGVRNPRRIGAVLGTAAIADEPDGKARRMLQGQITSKTFAVKAAELIQRAELGDSEFENGHAWIDFRGGPGTFPTYSFSEVLAGRVDAARLRDKIVVVGVTDPAGKDVFSTPTGNRVLSGAELQANAIATALEGFPLRSAPQWMDIALVIVAALLAPLLTLRFGTAGALGGGLAGLLVLAGLLQLAFSSDLILAGASPALALVLSTGGSTAMSSISDRRERHRLRDLFARFDPDVVAAVLSGDPGAAGSRTFDGESILAGFRIERFAGEGAMGVVYRATQLSLDRPVAVKLLRPEHADDPTYRQHFIAESRLAAAIEHPNILPVYEAGEEDGLLFLAMRFVDGLDLGQLLAQGQLAPARLLPLVDQLADALDAAHGHGLIHGDVKPENILLSGSDHEHAYLSDFGVAKRIEPGYTESDGGAWVGTPDYVAPEQLAGRGAVPQSDLYALGAVVYRCLTGEPPFPRETTDQILDSHLNAPPPRVSALVPDISSAIDHAVRRALAKEPRQRFASAESFAEALRASPPPFS